MIEILPSITSITTGGWKEKVGAVNKLKIKRCALFLSCLGYNDRQELFSTLEKTKLQSIPFVHARHDMTPREYDYLMHRWHTRAFNLHCDDKYAPLYNISKYKRLIYLENNPGNKINEKKLKKFAGLCVDFTHLEGDRLSFPEVYKHNYSIINHYYRGCAHISAIKSKKTFDNYSGKNRYDFHWLARLSELNYLNKFPTKIFPRYVAIELENDIARQVEIKHYIEKLLKKRLKNVKIIA